MILSPGKKTTEGTVLSVVFSKISISGKYFHVFKILPKNQLIVFL